MVKWLSKFKGNSATVSMTFWKVDEMRGVEVAGLIV